MTVYAVYNDINGKEQANRVVYVVLSSDNFDMRNARFEKVFETKTAAQKFINDIRSRREDHLCIEQKEVCK